MRKMVVLFACVSALAACDFIKAHTGASDTSTATLEGAATTTSSATTAGAAPAYVGTWAATAAACNIPQEQEGAPYIFNADGFDQHEAHCTFAVINPTSPNSWHAASACQVEGDEQSSAQDIAVNGDTMTLDGQHLVRCP